jgi:hypothetical protein
MKDSYEMLANAIILRAVRDYRDSLKKLKKYPKNKSALYTKREVERFFHSDWYALLTAVDPEVLLAKLKREVI